MIRRAISTLVDGHNLDQELAHGTMEMVLEGKATPSQVASFLTALRMKGETEDELQTFVEVLRNRATMIRSPPGSIDICGTGGDGTGTFNISTAAAFVIAADGVPMAKHGNGSISSASGSANVIGAMGIPFDLDPPSVERCLSETGMGFMMAPIFHRSMREVMTPRREIGIRTVFNLLGPTLNPAGVRTQLVGVYDPSLAIKMARVLMRTGSERVMVVNGAGLDEITNTGQTDIVELRDDHLMEYSIHPEDVGIETVDLDRIMGGHPLENARIMLDVLRGKESPRSDIVAMNAGAGLYLAGRSESLEEGVTRAKEILASGRGLRKLEQFADVCSRLELERQLGMNISKLVERKIHLRNLMERRVELCKYLLASIEGKEYKCELEALDQSIISNPNLLTYILLHRIIDMSSREIPEGVSKKSTKMLSASIRKRDGLSVIGEYKPSSPSNMGLHVPPRPEDAIDAYENAGVTGISVLCEPRFFNGGESLFTTIRQITDLPLLFKDFVFSVKQVEMARALGADSILLIASALNSNTLDDLVHHSVSRGIEPLVELHSMEDVEKVRSISNYDLIDMFGVNTRDLRTMRIDLETLPRMRSCLEDRVLIAESGFRSPHDLEKARGYDGVLIGTMFMGCSDIGATALNIVKRCREVLA